MTVGLLLITHERIGATLVEAATKMLGVCPLATEVMQVQLDCNPDAVHERACQQIGRLDSGDGVLVLTDIYGGTPSNIAMRLRACGHVKVIAGLNLPMLVRILNYANLTLDELAEKACSGGRDGILPCVPST